MIIITCHPIEIRKFLKVQFFILMVMYWIFLASHYVKRVRIWSFFGQYFPSFGLNTERYVVLTCALNDIYSKNVLQLFDEVYLGSFQTCKMEYFCENS